MAELTKELKAFWKDQLVPFHHEQLPQSGLSDSTLTFLSSVGLPLDSEKVKGSPFYLHFYDQPKMKRDHEGEDYLMIAENEGNEIGIHCQTDCLYYLDSFFAKGKRWMNADLSTFLMFLKIYLRHQPQLIDSMETGDEERIRGIVGEIKRQFHQFDPKALGEEETYWAVILEQVEDGLIC
ncbi:SUKH-4 family immunity protein [Thermoactinomyces vulgaris]|jgi:hypothetical protein|uniref:SUKH-4 family immunity protein n=1 Tax=Thermoactinomyces vulgaris TaxID=2026 RepID=A0ABS0QEK2_THEVU|nr:MULTISPECIES: SUKH-4 family immunity protein [Thermoactinomyces]KFZ41269.1 hypothetical protein JS81_02610 [Thermoactinomyces sp. Gus2-1]KYQ87554.1 hypothetical protein AYX07_02330 [Thermoactinomyces sp. AS95]MBA4551274.1 SUKH-4 family immunity protein [Thermoactinomyces vulgaris]MBA4595515.1 SUKH-4 family immunity protein [Thermoactinomyces vulgaris]MBH8587700.1 SUKH-4 family immunity protein [Thermoactinomyces vulgaris]